MYLGELRTILGDDLKTPIAEALAIVEKEGPQRRRVHYWVGKTAELDIQMNQ
jgi:hypothetical protein